MLDLRIQGGTHTLTLASEFLRERLSVNVKNLKLSRVGV